MKTKYYSKITLPLLLVILLKGCMVKPKQPKQPKEFIKQHSIELTVKKKEFGEIKLIRKGTIANDFNNPGCLRNGNPTLDSIAIGYAVAKYGKYLVFDTPQDGFFALQTWIELRGHWTLKKAINAFAPQVDFNNTSKYIRDICMDLNCKGSTKLGRINTIKLMNIISKLEGYNSK